MKKPAFHRPTALAATALGQIESRQCPASEGSSCAASEIRASLPHVWPSRQADVVRAGNDRLIKAVGIPLSHSLLPGRSQQFRMVQTRKRIRFIYQIADVTKPLLIWRAGQRFGLGLTIKDARLTRSVGVIDLELSGLKRMIEAAVHWFRREGVRIGGDSPARKNLPAAAAQESGVSRSRTLDTGQGPAHETQAEWVWPRTTILSARMDKAGTIGSVPVFGSAGRGAMASVPVCLIQPAGGTALAGRSRGRRIC